MRTELQLAESAEISLECRGRLLTDENVNLRELHDRYKDEDGFLYLAYCDSPTYRLIADYQQVAFLLLVIALVYGLGYLPPAFARASLQVLVFLLGCNMLANFTKPQ